MALIKAFRTTLGYVWRAIDNVRKVLHLFLLIFLFSILLSAVPGSVPRIPADAALVIRPFGFLVEEIAGDPFERAQAELLGQADPQTRVADILDTLEYAADDERISLVHLELSGFAGGGLSKLQRIAEAMAEFRESGKRIIASGEFMSQAGYYLAAHADEIYMHPEGMLVFNGYGAFRTYYRDAIEKLRIDWNVFRVGTHKSFTEPYTRMDMSDEDRESLGYLTDKLWELYRGGVIAARELPEGTLKKYTDEFVQVVEASGGDIMQSVLDYGFVDELLTREALQDRLIESVGEDPDNPGYPNAVGMYPYLDAEWLLNGDRTREENVAVVVAAGEFQFGDQPPGTIGSDSTPSLLREALNDESVKAVVLRIDSPGGAMFTSEVVADEILALQQAGKPVVASMGSVAASAGYFIAAGADRILASPATTTGSIGIIGMFPTYQRSLAALGIATDGVGSTPWAGELRPDREMSEGTRQVFQMVIERGYDTFVSHVASFRGMDVDAVDRIAQGKIWLGVDALDIGLVDELGGLDDAIRVAAELAELEEGVYGIKAIEQGLSPAEQLIIDFLTFAGDFGFDMSGIGKPATAVERLAQRVEAAVAEVDRFNDPKGLYYHCFCDFNR